MGRTRRCFTLDHQLSRRLDELSPRGERSRFVNEILEKALRDLEVVQPCLVFCLSMLLLALTVLATSQVA